MNHLESIRMQIMEKRAKYIEPVKVYMSERCLVELERYAVKTTCTKPSGCNPQHLYVMGLRVKIHNDFPEPEVL